MNAARRWTGIVTTCLLAAGTMLVAWQSRVRAGLEDDLAVLRREAEGRSRLRQVNDATGAAADSRSTTMEPSRGLSREERIELMTLRNRVTTLKERQRELSGTIHRNADLRARLASP